MLYNVGRRRISCVFVKIINFKVWRIDLVYV